MFLDQHELIALTGRQRSDAQARILRALGLEHRVRPDGTLVVLRAHVERLLGADAPGREHAQPIEPDWSAI
jgi:hypothetical protein